MSARYDTGVRRIYAPRWHGARAAHPAGKKNRQPHYGFRAARSAYKEKPPMIDPDAPMNASLFLHLAHPARCPPGCGGVLSAL
ncbi:hypothetical protein, partial [Herbaspirillum seropedicae]|uniref:hypothetical protein n=1 Tax=Herbaspirillum seropedicae TaxID=964 RepID=UPI0033939077